MNPLKPWSTVQGLENKLCSVLFDQVVLEILIVKVCFQLNVIEITLKTSGTKIQNFLFGATAPSFSDQVLLETSLKREG